MSIVRRPARSPLAGRRAPRSRRNIWITVDNLRGDRLLFEPIPPSSAPWLVDGRYGFLVFKLYNTSENEIFFHGNSVDVFSGEVTAWDSSTWVISLPFIETSHDVHVTVWVPTGGRVAIYLVPTGTVVSTAEALITDDILKLWSEV